MVVRAVRHHDDTSELMSLGDLERDYLVERQLPDDLEEPWNSDQERFIGLRDRVVILLGTPGTGKTTTLWGAIEKGTWQRALYLTWSERLAESAEATISFVKPEGSEVHVCSTLRFFAELLGGAWLELPTHHTFSFKEIAIFAKYRWITTNPTEVCADLLVVSSELT